nr:hypothetical protein [Chlamydiota bacterium]
SGEELKLTLQKFAWSVEADPTGWLKETGNLPEES